MHKALLGILYLAKISPERQIIWRFPTYSVSYLRGKCMTETPVVSSSNSVVFHDTDPPIRTVPAGEVQLEWDCRFFLSLCEGFHLPPLNLIQEVSVSVTPAQASSPVCVWSKRSSGRFGREHQGVPSLCRTSTDFSASPPLTMIAGTEINESVFQ